MGKPEQVERFGRYSSGRGDKRMKHVFAARALVVAAAMLAFPAPSAAVRPLTPRFSQETQARLLKGLSDAGLPEVAHNSVVIAITGALGLEAADHGIDRPSDYPQLPVVTGHVTRISEKCSRVAARAWLPGRKEEEIFRIEGIYCLVGYAQWAAARQKIRRRSHIDIDPA